METKKGPAEKDGGKLPAEWEKPSVKELDINAITLAGPIFSPTSDGTLYS